MLARDTAGLRSEAAAAFWSVLHAHVCVQIGSEEGRDGIGKTGRYNVSVRRGVNDMEVTERLDLTHHPGKKLGRTQSRDS